MDSKQRGGRRSGAGRPRLTPDGLVSHNVTLSAEDWAFIERLGFDNRSAGIRSALEIVRMCGVPIPSSPRTPGG
jgi:hypothetical protein